MFRLHTCPFEIPLDTFDNGKPDRSATPLAVRLDELDARLDRILETLGNDVLPALSHLEEAVAELAEGRAPSQVSEPSAQEPHAKPS